MPPEPAHPGPWRWEDPDLMTASLVTAADGEELYYVERLNANAQDDALVAAAWTLAAENQALRAALAWYADPQQWVPKNLYDAHLGTDPVYQDQGERARAALTTTATAPAAPGEPS